MDKEHKEFLELVRKVVFRDEFRGISKESLKTYPELNHGLLDKYYVSEHDLVEQMLSLERSHFMEIFDHYDFEGMNAIDILFIVSKEIAKKFYQLSPSVTHALKADYPDIFGKHFNARIQFIFMKIQINLQKGISQGIYRNDLSIELVSRLFISRLIDMHNPEWFPPREFSFKTLFEQMFESFVRSIATREGLDYFEEKKANSGF